MMFADLKGGVPDARYLENPFLSSGMRVFRASRQVVDRSIRGLQIHNAA